MALMGKQCFLLKQFTFRPSTNNVNGTRYLRKKFDAEVHTISQMVFIYFI